MGARDVEVNFYTFEDRGGISDRGKVHPRTGHVILNVYICIALLLQPRCQMAVGGQRHAPAYLPSGKTTGIHCTGVWMGPGSFWTGAENLAPA